MIHCIFTMLGGGGGGGGVSGWGRRFGGRRRVFCVAVFLFCFVFKSSVPPSPIPGYCDKKMTGFFKEKNFDYDQLVKPEAIPYW